ncbi:carbon-nitrogen hydrolase family protein [Erwinia sp. HR93]|uniref:carbon-nitrogen hydrolase family protein n=1 Tax=Erwinia sp. HR93 TaxID=3094840 RepID=UPI002ADEF306|nr:carbon-nitrogen hydrolase family protein [Erwinia sp. HR93]MEA1065257.1 carbon-nitrogen hydrolase family protein [Erwinia sp. HR93]
MLLWNIAAAQYATRSGGIGANIVPHLDFIERAASESVDLPIFPEASLHGDDMRECCENVLHSPLLAPLQQAAVKHAMTIVVGLVHKDACGQPAGALSFMPDNKRISCLSPRGAHADWCSPIPGTSVLGQRGRSFAMAVHTACNDESLPRSAALLGADLYVTGHRISETSWQNDVMYLQHWAHKYNMPVLMANQINESDSPRCVGRSACWDEFGQLVVRAEAGELLVIGRRHSRNGWQGEVIPVR